MGALNKLPVAVSGLLFFRAERDSTGAGNILSILLAFAGGLLYSLAQVQERRRKRYESMATKSPPLSSDGPDDSAILLKSVDK